MLESNTDRSYFMIGAVMVSAVVIAGALWIFREQLFGENGMVFTMVDGFFDKADKAVSDIDNTSGIGSGS